MSRSWDILEYPSADLVSDRAIQEAFKKLPGIIDTLDQEQAGVYKNQLRRLQKRYEDPQLKLAVIGNFSTGKSTFFNALIGQDLLSVSALPTTAIPTYVRWVRADSLACYYIKSTYDEKGSPIIRIVMDNGKAYTLEGSEKEQFQEAEGISLPDDTGAMLDYVTTTSSLIGKIKRIDVFFPERKGFEDFCLIDTPGINPGDEESREHIIQTQMVLREEADAVVLLYTAKDAMSKDTLRFMEDYGAAFMKDAIIILTKMDLAGDKQREKVLRRTERLIREQYHQSEPCLYYISAWEALEYISGRSDSEQSAYWSRQFEETVNDIMGQLGKRRREIISSRITALISAMIADITGIIQDKNGVLAEEKELLEKASIWNLEQEFKQISTEYQQTMMGKFISWKTMANKLAGEMQSEKYKFLSERIDRAGSSRELKSCLEKEYPDEMKKAVQSITNRLNLKVKYDVEAENVKYKKQAEDCLKRYGRFLGDAAMRSTELNTSRMTGISGSSGSSTENLHPSFVSDHMGVIVGVAFAAILGPLALAGGWMVDLWRLNAEKEKAKSRIQTELEDYGKKFVSACSQSLNDTYKKNLEWARNLLNDYIRQYQEAFNEIETNYNLHNAKVEHDLKTNAQSIETLKHLMQALSVEG